MKVYFTQIYPEPGAAFPFTHFFQKRITKLITAFVNEIATIVVDGDAYDQLGIVISSKTGMAVTRVVGPTKFPRDRDIEFTVFLPFRDFDSSVVTRNVMRELIHEVEKIFRLVDLPCTELEQSVDDLIEAIVSDPRILT